MTQEPIGVPACFSSSEKKPTGDPPATTITKSGQSMLVSVYRTKVAGQCRMITITWCKNVLLHGLSITIEGPEEEEEDTISFKIELKPWYFWRKQGSNRFQMDGKVVNISWDLRTAKFNRDQTEPQSDYYVAVVCEEEAVLLLGDRKKEAYRKTGSRQTLIEPILVSKKEHIFGKKKFCARGKFHEKGRVHEISIECSNKNNNHSGGSSSSSNSCYYGGGFDQEMEIRIDGHVAVHVKRLQWKFRGNECISVNKIRIEVYWDVHDWLFSPGLRHALFIFKPIYSSTTSSSSSSSSSSSLASSTPFSVKSQTPSSPASISVKHQIDSSSILSSGYCLFLYAWRLH